MYSCRFSQTDATESKTPLQFGSTDYAKSAGLLARSLFGTAETCEPR